MMESPQFSMVRFNLTTSLLSILNENDEDDIYFTLARYCLDHLDTLDTISIRQIEEECFASRSSVKRFFKSIGFDSFSAVKETLPELGNHMRAFLDYSSKPEFTSFIAAAIQDMMQDVNTAVTEEMLDRLARHIHDAGEVVLVCSDFSSSSARNFQQSMVLMGKVVRLITDSTAALKTLEQLTKDDLLLVSSISGNYALAITDSVSCVKAHKILITLNRSKLLRDQYDDVLYITQAPHSSDHMSPQRSVYNQYAGIYLLDRLYSHYVQMYRNEARFSVCKNTKGSKIEP